MKIIRYLAALLMILTAVLHLLPMFKSPQHPDAIPMLVFGIIYLTIGVFLILKFKYSTILGIVFPLIGLGIGFLKIGFENWDTMLSIMFLIDAIVVTCCILLMSIKNKDQVLS
ncbi:MAG: hypothetical protein ABFS35_20695 [Bacteroidota bacterium]